MAAEIRQAAANRYANPAERGRATEVGRAGVKDGGEGRVEGMDTGQSIATYRL